jgi:two-component system KDP operon response regulator KdpE
VDLTRHEVTIDGQTASLTPTEYDILRALIRHAGKVLTHQQLIHLVWGNNYEGNAHLLRVNISNLRRKIELDPSRPQSIMTEPGVGYRLKTLESARA